MAEEIVHEETYHGCEIMITSVGRGARPYRVSVNGDQLTGACRVLSSASIDTAVDYAKRHIRSLNSEQPETD